MITIEDIARVGMQGRALSNGARPPSLASLAQQRQWSAREGRRAMESWRRHARFCLSLSSQDWARRGYANRARRRLIDMMGLAQPAGCRVGGRGDMHIQHIAACLRRSEARLRAHALVAAATIHLLDLAATCDSASVEPVLDTIYDLHAQIEDR